MVKHVLDERAKEADLKSHLLPLACIIAWLIAGCGPQIPTQQPATAALVSTSPSTIPVEPSATAASTRRLTLTASPTTVADTPTPDIAGTIVATIQPEVYDSYLSPDGQWMAEVIIYPCAQVVGFEKNGYELLKLIQVSNGDEAIADTQLQYCGGLGGFGFEGRFWSPNSRYFYYTNAREGYPDGCGYWERPFIRLDMTDFGLENLGGGPRSPDGTKIATWQGRMLVVWDINEGEIARTQVDSINLQNGTGPIAWSPDSRALVHVQLTSYCPPSGESYVARLDLPDLRQTMLLESKKPSFADAMWETLDELKLFDENGQEWRYTFSTQELKPAP